MASLIAACAHGRGPTLAGYRVLGHNYLDFWQDCADRVHAGLFRLLHVWAELAKITLLSMHSGGIRSMLHASMHVAFSSDFGAQGFSVLLY